MTTAHQADIVRQAVAAIWNRGELRLADRLFDATYRNHHGLITDIVQGPEAIKISVALFRLAFPDLHITVDELIAEPDRVVVRWTAWADRSPTAASDTLTGVTICRLSGTAIAESWTYWDQERVLRQLGHIAAQRSPGAACDCCSGT